MALTIGPVTRVKEWLACFLNPLISNSISLSKVCCFITYGCVIEGNWNNFKRKSHIEPATTPIEWNF